MTEKKNKGSNKKKAVKALTDVKNQLFFIDQFFEQTNYNINKQLAEISVMVEKNNARINQFKQKREAYKKSLDTKKADSVDMLVDVFYDNFAITDKKVGLMEIHLKEVYQKIELLGKSVTKVCDVMLKSKSVREEEE